MRRCKALLPLIPAANSGTNQFVGSAVAPVNIQQGTANFNWVLSDANRINVYYAIQRDARNESPSTDGNAFPGMGDQRAGQRQIMTFNETWTVNPSTVNEFRLGYSRIHMVFSADLTTPSSQFDINNGGQQPSRRFRSPASVHSAASAASRKTAAITSEWYRTH